MSAWTRNQLLRLYDMNARSRRLADIAPFVGHTATECDIALWAILITDTVSQALERLNGSIAAEGVTGAVKAVPQRAAR